MEWKINLSHGMSNILAPEVAPQHRACCRFFVGLLSRLWRSIQKAWKFGTKDPKKLIHSFKVGVALCLVSLFYYMRPLYEGVGGNAMWAVLTVVIAFEYTVGSTICKCLNRATATLIAGALGIGVHWIANQFGGNFEPFILQASVFVLASVATFSRFVPSVKAQYDHGALIFIITFTMVSVSGYRVGELFKMAYQRLSTIGIGTSICILTSMLLCPVWAGNELHNLIKNNMEKIADSLDGCVAEYFINDANANDTKNEVSNGISMGYKCLLNSRATEESLANFARWEPAHGGFNLGHPWKEYLQVGEVLRSCAYCIDALRGAIISDTKAPDFLKKRFSKLCIKLSSNSSAVLKELVVTNTMAKSPKIDVKVEEMCNAVEEVQIALKTLCNQPIESKSEQEKDESIKALCNQPTESKSEQEKEESNACPIVTPSVEIVALVTLSSLLIEIAARIEKIVKAVNGLAQKRKS